MLKEALLYETLAEGRVRCNLCSHRCTIASSKFGVCGVKQNKEGKLYTHVYGSVIAAHVDPIEKKPLYHFLPGSSSFSIATIGCNFRCPYCQNWQISQTSVIKGEKDTGHRLSPEEVVYQAKLYRCKSISYTYTEPTIFFEYAYDCARLAKEEGLANVFVTNAYMTPEAIQLIKPHLDACNVDLKSFREEFYTHFCRAHLQPVLDAIRLMKESSIWVELTTLVIPGENDSEEELKSIASFIADLDPDIPWHISRFHPDYKYDRSQATPIATLRQAVSIGREEGLHYVYIGNVLGESEDTLCPHCGRVIISRFGYNIKPPALKNSSCAHCGHRIAGVF
ncbi:MAG: AmmeMemoRadiSam system radical SAM enzyme [Candidatus Aminicenantales bacterium]